LTLTTGESYRIQAVPDFEEIAKGFTLF
jgi:hypothetical protein